MAGVNLGVAHPPGYPLYTLIVHLFTRLPFGDPAVPRARVERGARRPGLRRPILLRPAAARVVAAGPDCGVGVGAVLVAGHRHRGLHAQRAALLRCFALALRVARNPLRWWPCGASPSLGGASLASHWPLMVLATPGLALALLPVWRAVLPRLPRLLAAALASAVLPYAWMVWLSHQGPAISFYGPIETVGRVLVPRRPAGLRRRRRQPQRLLGRPRGVPGVVRGRPRAANDAPGDGARGARPPRVGAGRGPLPRRSQRAGASSRESPPRVFGVNYFLPVRVDYSCR